MRVQHYRVAPLLIAVSDMALTIPMELALTLDLKVLELPFSTAPLGTNLYWHKSADHDKANQWMRELIREIY
jgi:DNA-binding transcriptional LysR family regulator